MSMASGGGAIAVGAPGAEQVHIFLQSGEHVAVLRAPDGASRFGHAVAIIDEGGPPILAVTAVDADVEGARGAGVVYLYDTSTLLPLGTLHAPRALPGLGFGNQLAVVGDTLLCGANSADRGGAWLFGRDGKLIRAFDAPPGAGSFGRGVAGVPGVYVIGAPGSGAGPDAPPGAVYVFGRGPSPRATIHSPSPQRYDLFGVSVATDGHVVLVGESGDPAPDAELPPTTARPGSVHVFDARTLAPVRSISAGGDDLFGWSVKLLGDGWAAASAPYADLGAGPKKCNAGAAYAVRLDTGKLVRLKVRGLRCADWLGGFRIDGHLDGGVHVLAGAPGAFGSTRHGRAFVIGPIR
jgi:hypothetical protein